MKRVFLIAGTVMALTLPALAGDGGVSYGPRPFFLIDAMKEGPLKETLTSCKDQTPRTTAFSIGHRGAPLMFPEHTVESNRAAARMGAGLLECDVTFTKDKKLVCRHAQNDLHTTTDILTTPLADTCVIPFSPARGDAPATAECRTSELTLEQFRSLTPKMDAANRAATTAQAYQNATAGWRTDLYTTGAHLMTHAESIELFRTLGAKFTPELKSPSVEMPFDGFTQADYAQKLIDEYKAAGIPAQDVFAQSFNLEDVLYWIGNEPEFGKQAVVYLDGSYDIEGWDHMDPATWTHQMDDLKAMGVNYIAPPLWVLVTLDEAGKIVPSIYAEKAGEAGLNIFTWTLERSGPLGAGGGWYFQSIAGVTENDGMYFELLDVLARDVKVKGVFSDWPATVTYYANCMGL
ncbi:glycerophosphoryl diester phosphodiesterase [Rhodovulum imhoffii]|uniref:glycerophosphodiester phosphodiesterase n=1 Tax=Rhodovulum imhoffii TaxID=365340 RepID=A0A2T5BNV1_9RHOB|nr:glycerophosphodiester phosphodiesterase family protein [Rhodovulum imhoffii]MBK5933840.1 glycerophosphodiester phosphodiesterase [Rhodovulum imhoffii]PTN00668.1 glycerophosphoryl diester phosphodiesterase [Rhodovulum imhoffii]